MGGTHLHLEAGGVGGGTHYLVLYTDLGSQWYFGVQRHSCYFGHDFDLQLSRSNVEFAICQEEMVRLPLNENEHIDWMLDQHLWPWPWPWHFLPGLAFCREIKDDFIDSTRGIRCGCQLWPGMAMTRPGLISDAVMLSTCRVDTLCDSYMKIIALHYQGVDNSRTFRYVLSYLFNHLFIEARTSWVWARTSLR